MGGLEWLVVLGMVTVIVWLGLQFGRGTGPRLQLPDSRFLKTLLAFCAAGLGTKLGLLLFRKNETISDTVGNFFVDLVVPYCYGAFGSDFLVVWLGATAAGASFALAVCKRGRRAASVAKTALGCLFMFSLFTIWLEPFISFSAATEEVLMKLAKVPMKVLDIGVSIIWLLLWRYAALEVDRKVALPHDSEPGTATCRKCGQVSSMIGSTCSQCRAQVPRRFGILALMIAAAVIILVLLLSVALWIINV